jgi:hypothetical protein
VGAPDYRAGEGALLLTTFEPPPSDDASRDLREISPYPGDEGELIGKPEVSPEILAQYHREKNPLKALRARCMDCCCGMASEVRKCTAVMCPSWSFRMGTNPHREKRVLSPEQKAARVQRLAKGREG